MNPTKSTDIRDKLLGYAMCLTKKIVKTRIPAMISETKMGDNVQSDDNTDTVPSHFAILIEDIVVLVSSYTAYKQPSSLTKLRRINKHWNKCLNPNKLNVNRIWENNICRVVFEYTPKHSKIKRWDRYFQHKLYALKYMESLGSFRNKSTSETLDNDVDNMYQSNMIIEGCDYDTKAINSYHSDNVDMDKQNENKKGGWFNKSRFKNGIDKNSGLPKGFKRKLKCPMTAANLNGVEKYRAGGKYYCHVCKKNVFRIYDIEDFKEKINNGQGLRCFVNSVGYGSQLMDAYVSKE